MFLYLVLRSCAEAGPKLDGADCFPSVRAHARTPTSITIPTAAQLTRHKNNRIKMLQACKRSVMEHDEAYMKREAYRVNAPKSHEGERFDPGKEHTCSEMGMQRRHIRLVPCKFVGDGVGTNFCCQYLTPYGVK